MLQSSCNPTSLPPPPFHPYTLSVGKYRARERGYSTTIRQTYCDHCKDWQKAGILAVPSTKQRAITRWWYPPFLLRGISPLILPFLLLGAVKTHQDNQCKKMHFCPVLRHTSCLGKDDHLSCVQIAGNAPKFRSLCSSVLLQMLSRPRQQHSLHDQHQGSGSITQL